MSSLSIPITLCQSYENEYVRLHVVKTQLTIPLVEATSGRISTPLTVVGELCDHLKSVDNCNLVGSISLWYGYDPGLGVLTLCSNDLLTEDSTYISTFPEADPSQRAIQHSHGLDVSPCETNSHWNYCTSLTPGIQQLFQQIVKDANQSVIETAKNSDLTVIIRTPFPESSTFPSWLIFRQNEFQGFHDAKVNSATLQPDDKLVHISSIWYGEIYLKTNDYFANVIGSTNDPKIDRSSWINLWQHQFGAAPACSSWNWAGNQAFGRTSFTCTDPQNYLYGGHVILGTQAKVVQPGSNQVFIIPICAAHNNNDNVYMCPIKIQKGIALHNYLGK